MGVKHLRRRGTYGILIGRCAGRRCVASMLWVVRCYAHHVGPIEAKRCLDVMVVRRIVRLVVVSCNSESYGGV